MPINLGSAAAQMPLQRQKVKGAKPMPYVSQKQRGYFNANRKKMESQGVNVGEWNQASKGKDLPEKAGPPPKPSHWTGRAVGKSKKK